MNNLLVSVGEWKVWDAGAGCVSITHERFMDTEVTVDRESFGDLMDTLRVYEAATTTEITVK